MLAKLWETTRRIYERLPLPSTRRRVALDCLEAPAELSFDAAGVPYIFAQSQHDVAVLQGYVHARDRLFQMEMLRRMAQGRISEVVGRQPLGGKGLSLHFDALSTVELDGLLRLLDLEGAARLSVEQVSASYRSIARAYASGVNAFLRAHPLSRPLELRLLGSDVEPWGELDPFLVHKAFAFNLALSWQAKLTVEALVASHPEQAPSMLALLGITSATGMPHVPQSTPELEQIRRLASFGRGVVETTGFMGGGMGSNAWAVGGELSADGQPLLAADPHLPTFVPSFSYFQHLEAPGLKVSGTTTPGMPGVIMGHNETCAFAMTHAWIDDSDLFSEEVRADGSCLGPDGWEPLACDVTTIMVKGEDPVEMTLRRSPRGGLLDGLFAAIPDRQTSDGAQASDEVPDGAQGRAMALRWSGQDGGRDLESFWAMDRAHSWGEFRKASALLSTPVLNVVYADRDGHIGYQMAGWVPQRSWEGGLAVVQGRSSRGWHGYVDFDELPFVLDPAQDMVVSANQRIVDDDYPHYLSALFEPPFRADRARRLLAQGKLDVHALRAAQLDQKSEWAERINERWLQPLSATIKNPDARLALLLLAGWDGSMHAEQAAPAVFYQTVLAFVRRLLVARLGDWAARAILELYTMPALALEKMLAQGEEAWFGADEILPPDSEALMELSLADAVCTLRELLGPQTTEWRWGRLHQRRQKHAFDGVPVLSSLFNLRAVEAGGDGTTLNTGLLRFGASFEQVGGTDARLIVDLGDFERSRWVNASGQSGHPYARNYRDQFDLLMAGEDRPWPFSRDAIAAASRSILEAVPCKPKHGFLERLNAWALSARN
ncbi:MAG: penicillin acylase family protein [Deltaproteobacteria bacterium]|nr:penicillin acylase family protein [Deltaproteobacteria bacterium]